MGKQSKRPRNKKKGGSNSSPSKTTAAAATIAAATATAASMSSSSAETLPKINQPQQQYHNQKKNENMDVDRHGGGSLVGQRQKPEQVKAVGKENSNINVVLRPMGWTAPFESNYVGKYDQEDQCVSCQGLIDIDNHPWFCGHTGRILMV
mmetsp:Transcript_15839/g.17109  ORF Transcript_15839/g.17109 Transcript_15839/m.17109 type:complete len:150 (+) Transcript_15839:91-540(+)